MEHYTTLRIRNTAQETGGEWFTESVTDYHYRVLREMRAEEPQAGWKLQTRGLSTSWHDYEPTLSAFA